MGKKRDGKIFFERWDLIFERWDLIFERWVKKRDGKIFFERWDLIFERWDLIFERLEKRYSLLHLFYFMRLIYSQNILHYDGGRVFKTFYKKKKIFF